MLNNITKSAIDLIGICITVLVISSCAGSGGASTSPTITPPISVGANVTAETDKRYLFQDFTQRWDNFGGVSAMYTSATFQPSADFISNDKYKIADYGFLRQIITGQHTGDSTNDGEVPAGPWPGNAVWMEADLNGDDHVDMFSIGNVAGIDTWNPDGLLLAWINDGEGHFTLSQDIFADGVFPCISNGTMYEEITDYRCGSADGYTNGMLVADFNGDGISDYYDTGILYLSNDGKLENKGQSNLPDIFFSDHIGRVFVHDADEGDADGDGDLDIFLPIFGSTKHGFMVDGSYAGCDGCNEPLPWVMLVNDGAGNFFANTNFNVPRPLANGDQLWATTAAIGDFDNDGFGDVAVGWFNPALASQYGYTENSAGAVFLNDGNNDWRNRATIELPANWYGANGVANDMELLDFNGDGYLDIILGSTQLDPNYMGTILQFFQNNAGTNFSDVTNSIHPNLSKYATSSGSNYGNGQGKINILDFDHDGDLDIVHTNTATYALVNNGGGTWAFYDDFIDLDSDRVLFPVEIDGKFQYDFIASTVSCDEDQCITDFFQVLDPPLAEMQDDITSKPHGYSQDIFNNHYIISDLRKQSKGTQVFSKVIQGTNLLGYSSTNNSGYGLFVGTIEGNQNGVIFGADYEDGNKHTGFAFIKNTLRASNKTKWYGTGYADVEVQSVNAFVEHTHLLNNIFYSTIGSSMHFTSVKSFLELGSQFNVKVDEFNMGDLGVFADINYIKKSRFGTTYITAGLDYYTSLLSTKIYFGDYLSYDVDNELFVSKIGLLHSFGPFYISVDENSENMDSYRLGFNLKLFQP
tara:strand:+ start:587 stop:3013 length:2427 start_codon:yes stop_codon:yes gene_type:complete